MTPQEREQLVHAATTSHRHRDVDGTLVLNGAWMDLDANGRREAFERAAQLREWERASDPQGRSSTVRAVLARLTRP